MSQITENFSTETLHWSFAWNLLSVSPETICTGSKRESSESNHVPPHIPTNNGGPLRESFESSFFVDWVQSDNLEWFALKPLHWSSHWIHWVEGSMSWEKSWKSWHQIFGTEISPGNFLLVSRHQIQILLCDHPLELAKLKVGSFVRKTVEKSHVEISLSVLLLFIILFGTKIQINPPGRLFGGGTLIRKTSVHPREVYYLLHLHVFCFGGVDFISRLRLRDGRPPAPENYISPPLNPENFFSRQNGIYTERIGGEVIRLFLVQKPTWRRRFMLPKKHRTFFHYKTKSGKNQTLIQGKRDKTFLKQENKRVDARGMNPLAGFPQIQHERRRSLRSPLT